MRMHEEYVMNYSYVAEDKDRSRKLQIFNLNILEIS
jgi:hypothetical protein